MQYDGLEPLAQYDVTLVDEHRTIVSYLRATADARGVIPPHILFYQSGVAGCAQAAAQQLELPYRFRTFDEAERGLAEHVFSVEVRPASREEFREDAEPLYAQRVVFRNGGEPLIYFSDREGCLMNAMTNEEEVFVTVRNLPRDFDGELLVVAHQEEWQPGDVLNDVRPLDEPQRITRGESWMTIEHGFRAGELAQGPYDVVLHAGRSDGGSIRFGENDIAGWQHDTGIVVQFGPDDHGGAEGSPNLGGWREQIAGRPLARAPWFEHIDGFAAGSNVWAAIDPSRVHSSGGGTYAACYVVDHQSGWTHGDPLVDVSGGFEVMPIKPGCINGTKTLIWPSANPSTLTETNPTQAYDVVLDFGTVDSHGFHGDATYDHGSDIIDGVPDVGFWLLRDPRLPGEWGTIDFEYPSAGKDCSLDVRGLSLTYTDPPYYTTAVAGAPFSNGAWDINLYTPCSTGQTVDRVEMRGHFYVPVDSNGNIPQQKFPLVVILHGQQRTTLDKYNKPIFFQSYLGYRWLADALASHGYVVYSIDATSWEMARNGDRGELVRAVLRRLAQMNVAGWPISGRLDMNDITLIGHSRGGEAVVAAYEWNRVSPENYRINALIALAPTGNLGTTGGWEPVDVFPHIRRIPYMILQGSMDNDTKWFPGLTTYDHAGDGRNVDTLVAAKATAPKAMQWIEKANHNWFNTVWESAEGDDVLRDPKILLDPALQRETAQSYIVAALQSWIHGFTGYEHYLNGTVPNVTQANVLHDHQSPRGVILDDFTDKKTTVTPDNGAVTWTSLASVTTFVSDKPYGNDAGEQFYPGYNSFLRVRWNQPGTYTFEVTPAVRAKIDPLLHRVLALRASQWYDRTNNANALNTSQSIDVQLHDALGHASPWIPLSRFGGIPPLWENDDTVTTNKPVMVGFRIPLDVFSSIVPEELDLVTFRFGPAKSGEVIIDDVRLSD